MSDKYLKPYFKAWVAFIAAMLIGFISVIEPALEDNVVTAREWLSAAVALLGVVGVWMAPNTPFETAYTDPYENPQEDIYGEQ